MTVKRNLQLLNENITPENVESMSEMITICETKHLIGWAGKFMIDIHNNLLLDVFNKNQVGYVLTDSYDLVQQVALFLCENMGKKLSDIHHIDKKGKVITIAIQACKEITKITNCKFRRLKTDLSFEGTPESVLPFAEIIEEDTTSSEEDIDTKSLINNLGLNEMHLAVLNGRLEGMSFPQIAEVIQRAAGTVYDYLLTIQRRYTTVYG